MVTHPRAPRHRRRRRIALLAVGAAVTSLAVTSLTAVTSMAAVAGSASAAAPSPTGCSGWTVTPFATGLGSVENLTPDGAGGFYIASTDRSAVEQVTGTGTRRTVAADVDTPGGLVLRGDTLYFNSGDSPLNTVFGLDGYIGSVNLTTGAKAKVATVTAPNGLAALPDGSLVATSSALPGLSGITRVVPATGAVQKGWSPVWHSNGATVKGSTLYTDDPYSGRVLAVPFSTAADGSLKAGSAKTVADVGTLLDVVDDMAVDASGMLYVAANSGGRIERVDPASGAHCAIATFATPSSIRLAVGPRGPALYVSSFDGILRELTPPPGVGLT